MSSCPSLPPKRPDSKAPRMSADPPAPLCPEEPSRAGVWSFADAAAPPRFELGPSFGARHLDRAWSRRPTWTGLRGMGRDAVALLLRGAQARGAFAVRCPGGRTVACPRTAAGVGCGSTSWAATRGDPKSGEPSSSPRSWRRYGAALVDPRAWVYRSTLTRLCCPTLGGIVARLSGGWRLYRRGKVTGRLGSLRRGHRGLPALGRRRGCARAR